MLDFQRNFSDLCFCSGFYGLLKVLKVHVKIGKIKPTTSLFKIMILRANFQVTALG